MCNGGDAAGVTDGDACTVAAAGTAAGTVVVTAGGTAGAIGTAGGDFISGPGPMSALPPKADMCGALVNVCFGPEADSCSAAKRTAIQSPRRRARGGCMAPRSRGP